MKTLFDIRSDGEAAAEQNILLLEIGKDYCAYAFWNKSFNVIHRLQFISYDEREAEAQLPKLIEELEQNDFQSVVISPGFPQTILSPAKFFTGEYNVLNTLYEQTAQTNLHDAIPEWQMVILYSIPQWLHEILKTAFVSLQYIHAYTPAIKVYNGYVADNQLLVHFTPQHFRVLLKKDSAIQLAQTYYYTAPLDVVYYLLKICSGFGLEQSTVAIILSGLIEKDSGLYAELQQYFTNLHFAHPPEIKLPESHHPHYFFTSLYNLAACVS